VLVEAPRVVPKEAPKGGVLRGEANPHAKVQAGARKEVEVHQGRVAVQREGVVAQREGAQVLEEGVAALLPERGLLGVEAGVQERAGVQEEAGALEGAGVQGGAAGLRAPVDTVNLLLAMC